MIPCLPPLPQQQDTQQSSLLSILALLLSLSIRASSSSSFLIEIELTPLSPLFLPSNVSQVSSLKTLSCSSLLK